MNQIFLDNTSTEQQLGASIELTANQALDSPTLLEEVPVGTEVYLPDLGAEGIGTALKAAHRLASLGYSVVPHLAARRAESVEAVESRLRDLKRGARTNKILVIAGDQARPAGPFTSTMDVLQTNLLEKYGFNDIRVAGHPEGSRDFDDDVALEALREKMEFCKQAGAQLRIVTQFGFDADAVIGWSQRIREAGIDVPIDIGVAGPARLSTLIKYAGLCGVGNSASFLMKRTGQIANLMRSQTSEPLVRAVENSQARGLIPNLGNIHVFAFGGIRNSSDWLVQRGSWAFERD